MAAIKVSVVTGICKETSYCEDDSHKNSNFEEAVGVELLQRCFCFVDMSFRTNALPHQH